MEQIKLYSLCPRPPNCLDPVQQVASLVNSSPPTIHLHYAGGLYIYSERGRRGPPNDLIPFPRAEGLSNCEDTTLKLTVTST